MINPIYSDIIYDQGLTHIIIDLINDENLQNAALATIAQLIYYHQNTKILLISKNLSEDYIELFDELDHDGTLSVLNILICLGDARVEAMSIKLLLRKRRRTFRRRDD